MRSKRGRVAPRSSYPRSAPRKAAATTCYAHPMPAPHTSPGASLFGSKGFWTLAIIGSIAWALIIHFNGENEKADNAKESARLDTVATEQTAVAKCEQWMRELYDGPGFKVISLDVVGSNRTYRTYAIDAVVQRQAPVNKKSFQTTERCNVYWSSYDDAWDVRVR